MAPETQLSRPLWVVSELYYPEETSTGHVLTRICEGLAERRPVRVVCGQPSYAARGVRAPWRETRRGVEIVRVWATTWNKDSLPRRLVNAATITISIFLALLFRLRRGDRVLVVTNPPFLPFLTQLACWLRHADCYLLIHDVYPEVAVAAGLLRDRGLAARLINGLTRRLYLAAERIIALGRDMAALIHHKAPLPTDRVVVIPNGADVDQIAPESRGDNRLLAELGLTNKFVVQYSGNMGRSHAIECLAACAERLRDDPEIHFLAIGWGAKRAWLTEQVRTKNLTNVTIIDPVPRDQLVASLNACDLSLIPFVAGMAGVSVPCRMYNVLAAGKPIVAVADAHSELALVVQEEGVGYVVEPGDVDGLARAVLAARNDLALRTEMGRRAQNAAQHKYAWRHIVRAYESLFWGHRNDAQQTTSRRAA